MPVHPNRRLELASPDWIRAASESLSESVAGLGSAAEDLGFSVCERYSDAPPHLAADGKLSWHVRVVDGQVSVAAGDLTDADVMISGRYHAALPIARTVYAGDPSAGARATRLSAHWFGKGSTSLRGEFRDPRALPLLAQMHDALARRTIDDPDLAHRTRQQGLERATQELEEKGYAVLEGALDDAASDALREAILERVAEQKPSPSAAMLMERGPIFEAAALHPWLMTLAEHICGKGFLMAQLLGLQRPTASPPLGLHSDYNLIREPFPAYRQACTAIWALEDFTLEAGPTTIVPGSHLRKRHPEPGEGQEELVPILMPKGSIAIWDGASWHSQAPRTSEGDRVTLHSTYSRMTLRTYDFYRDIDTAILDRNPPELMTLAGLDDVFEKNSYSGADFRKLAHAQQLFRS
jgi:hypothetical protein